VNVQIRSVFTDAENGECFADIDLLLQKIQESSVISAKKIISGQFENLQGHAVLDSGIWEDQEIDGDFGDYIRMSSIVARDAQRISYFCISRQSRY